MEQNLLLLIFGEIWEFGFSLAQRLKHMISYEQYWHYGLTSFFCDLDNVHALKIKYMITCMQVSCLHIKNSQEFIFFTVEVYNN